MRQRVAHAAEAALSDHGYVGLVDVLMRMGLLAPAHVRNWHHGIIPTLDQVIQGSAEKFALTVASLHEWAREKGLQPSSATYTRQTRAGEVALRFTVDDPFADRIFCTHLVPPEVSGGQRKSLERRAVRAQKPVVFMPLRDSACSECGVEIGKDEFLYMEAGQPLCLACGNLDELEYLPAGDAALTRRATKYSGRSAVVVRFSRSRKRYERQGVLVEPAALAKAGQECVSDDPQRAARRVRDADRRAVEDRDLVSRMDEQIRALFPGCPSREARAIAEHTAKRRSGRIGRSAAGRKLDPKALTLAVVAAIRHRHTSYDELLSAGWDRASARTKVAGQVDSVLDAWRPAE